jgi:hypothetical protein
MAYKRQKLKKFSRLEEIQAMNPGNMSFQLLSLNNIRMKSLITAPAPA